MDGGYLVTCPVPNAHDKFREAIYFFHQMHESYHRPAEFRFNLHAFLNALTSIDDFIRLDLEKIGLVQEWKAYGATRDRDELLESLKGGRNRSTHQAQLLCESEVSIGIFRNRTIKLAVEDNLATDIATATLLEGAVDHLVGNLIDSEHSAIGEQIGVKRLYYEKTAIRNSEDLLTSIRRAVTRVSHYLAKGHELANSEFTPEDEDSLYEPGWSDEVTVLLETDVNPELVEQWGWN